MEEWLQIPKQFNLRCIGNQTAHLFCSQVNCQNSAVVCSNQQCQCQKNQHVLCSLRKIKAVMNQINKSKVKTNEISQLIRAAEQIYDNIIQLVSIEKEKIIERMEYWGLSDSEISLIKIIRDQKQHQIKGKLIDQVIKDLFRSKSQQQLQMISKNDIKGIWQSQKKKVLKICDNLNADLQNILRGHYKFESAILLEEQQKRDLHNLFDNKVKQFKLLYRASQNKFLASKFHQKCDGIPNTVTLVKTQNNKIVGGYTPLQWVTAQDIWAEDKSESSFVFSLSNKKKYPIINKRQAIYHKLNYGPIFGHGNQIWIRDKANTDSKSSFNLGKTYNDGKVSYNTSETKQSYIGVNSTEIKLLDWQVYEVLLKNDPK